MIQKRHTQSKRKIKAAVTELLMENSDFNTITIRKITEKAHVNRSTFYLHYLDKYDLIDKLMHEITDHLKKELSTESFDMRENLIRSLLYLQSQQQFIQAVANIGQVNFSQKTRNFIRKLVEENPGFLYEVVDPRLKLPQEYMIATYVASVESIYNHWITTGAKETPEQVADMVLTIREFYKAPTLDPVGRRENNTSC